MSFRAKFVNGVFKPIEELKKLQAKYKNKEVELEVIPSLDEMIGILEDVKLTSVELQHKIKKMW